MELIQQTVAGMVIHLRGFPLWQEERFTEIKLPFLDKGISNSILDKGDCSTSHRIGISVEKKQIFLQLTQEGCKSIGIKIHYLARVLQTELFKKIVFPHNFQGI